MIQHTFITDVTSPITLAVHQKPGGIVCLWVKDPNENTISIDLTQEQRMVLIRALGGRFTSPKEQNR